MDYSRRWAEPQPQAPVAPPLSHNQPDPYLYSAPPQPVPQHHLPRPVAYSSYHYPNPNPNATRNPNPYPYPTIEPENPFQSDAHAGHLRFPAVPYVRGLYAPRGGHEALHPAPYCYPGGGGPPAVPGVSYHYHGLGGSEPRGFVVEQVIHSFGDDLLGYGAGLSRSTIGLEPPIQSHTKPPCLNNKVMHPASKLMKKRISKDQKWTTKVVQSAYCEVCKINCDTQEVLAIHKQGKKHRKNLQKLQESITAKTKEASIAPVEKETAVAEKGKAVVEQKRKTDTPVTAKELEEKKRRVLEGGAAAEGVKVCTLCNVVVNSQKVYEYHIAGQKHAAMVKKQQEEKATVKS